MVIINRRWCIVTSFPHLDVARRNYCHSKISLTWERFKVFHSDAHVMVEQCAIHIGIYILQSLIIHRVLLVEFGSLGAPVVVTPDDVGGIYIPVRIAVEDAVIYSVELLYEQTISL